MIIQLSRLKQRAISRPPGYLEDVLSQATRLDDDRYELSDDTYQVLVVKYRRTPIGLGDVVKSAIHIGIDLLPISDSSKTQIKSCSKCAARAAALNKMIPNINPFTNSPSDKSDSSK